MCVQLLTKVSVAQTKKYKMVRIPEEEYDALLRAKHELLRKGLDSLPEDFPDEEEEEATGGEFTLGLLVGLGAAALVYLLTRNKQQGGER